MKAALCLLILLAGAVSRAEVVISSPRIELPGSESYSCRILRHRVKDRIKGHAGLHALLESMEAAGWSASGARRLEAQLGRSGYFPKYYFERGVKVTVDWMLSPEWAGAMNADRSLPVFWSFKGFDWEEETGILPEGVRGEWRSAESELTLTTWITPLQLCFGPADLRLQIRDADKTLELWSFVEWP